MRDFITTFVEDLQDRWADRNSRIKVAKIRRVFAREGGLIAGALTTSGVDICDHPGRCAMGALLAAAGVTDANLQDGMTDSNYDVAKKVYGLGSFDVGDIISANDSHRGRPIWEACGVSHRPVQIVRVCVVNERVRELASA